jgi:hypothetical protein
MTTKQMIKENIKKLKQLKEAEKVVDSAMKKTKPTKKAVIQINEKKKNDPAVNLVADWLNQFVQGQEQTKANHEVSGTVEVSDQEENEPEETVEVSETDQDEETDQEEKEEKPVKRRVGRPKTRPDKPKTNRKLSDGIKLWRECVKESGSYHGPIKKGTERYIRARALFDQKKAAMAASASSSSEPAPEPEQKTETE